jgi:hypothetical protein
MPKEAPCPTSREPDAASTHGGDVVSNKDAEQQPRSRGKQQPRKPIAHSFTSAQSRPVVARSDCMHRAYFRFGIQVRKESGDLKRVEFEQRLRASL